MHGGRGTDRSGHLRTRLGSKPHQWSETCTLAPHLGGASLQSASVRQTSGLRRTAGRHRSALVRLSTGIGGLGYGVGTGDG